ncbi:hypothetical protein RSAG8_06426, partial [Rhizoctonia solani AG-8 WAC10335]
TAVITSPYSRLGYVKRRYRANHEKLYGRYAHLSKRISGSSVKIGKLILRPVTVIRFPLLQSFTYYNRDRLGQYSTDSPLDRGSAHKHGIACRAYTFIPHVNVRITEPTQEIRQNHTQDGTQAGRGKGWPLLLYFFDLNSRASVHFHFHVLPKQHSFPSNTLFPFLSFDPSDLPARKSRLQVSTRCWHIEIHKPRPNECYIRDTRVDATAELTQGCIRPPVFKWLYGGNQDYTHTT